MQHIGDYHDALDRINAARHRYRAERLERYGWDPTVECVDCGDSGWLPERDDTPCLTCERGRRLDQERKRDREWDAICPPRFREYRLDGHPNPAAVSKVRRWIAEGEARGHNLILAGPVGTGKTGMAIAALRELFIAGRTVRHGTVASLLEAMRPRDDGEPAASVRELQRVNVLLLDDLGMEKASEWQAERLFLIADGRYENALPTIVTTNRPDWQERVGERITSRLMSRAVTVAVAGADLRKVDRLRVVQEGA